METPAAPPWALDQELPVPQVAQERPGVHVNDLPLEVVSEIYYYIDDWADKWSFLLTQRRWFEMAIDDMWLRPGIVAEPQLKALLGTLTSESTFDYARMIRRLNLTSVQGSIDDSVLAPFKACHDLERLVLVGASRLSSSLVSDLVSGNPLLTSIDVSQVSQLEDEVLLSLARSCPRLQGIYAASCKNFSDLGVIELAKSCPLLKRVRFSDCPLITDVGVQELVSRCQYIVELDLSQTDRNGLNSISDTTAQMIVALPQLRELRLPGHKKITDAAFTMRSNTPASDSASVQTSTPLEQLRLIDLSSCELITDAAVEAIVMAAPRLHHVALGRCDHITDTSLVHLARLESSIHYLHFGHCVNITDRGVSYIGQYCTRLQYIDLANCTLITNASVRSLSGLNRLRRIGLVKCARIDDNGILYLTDRSWAENPLERIHLSYCSAITANAIMILVNACPKLTHLSLTGVMSFLRPEYSNFCRQAPEELSDHQKSVFCVYSGAGVKQLRDYLNRTAPDHESYEDMILRPGAGRPRPDSFMRDQRLPL